MPTIFPSAQGVRGRVRALNTAAGARAEVGNWQIELSGGYGVQREHYDGVNLIHFLRLPRAGTNRIAQAEPAIAFATSRFSDTCFSTGKILQPG